MHSEIPMRILKHFSKIQTRNTAAFFFSFFIVSFLSLFVWNSNGVVLYSQRGETSGDAFSSVAPMVVLPPPPPPPEHIKTPAAVRAVYMTSWVAGTPSLRNSLITFVADSEINSIVVDIKDYSGKVSFEMNSPTIAAMQSVEQRIPDVRALIGELHQKGMYVIGRVSVFQDPQATHMRPELAVQNKNGGVWKDRKGLSYIDPGAQEYWKYIVAIARESENVGFDEINFDYIRFPSDGQLALAVFPYQSGRAKADVLEEFFIYLHDELKDLPTPISADIFGLVTWVPDDLNIGQVFERIAPHFDYIAPMVYPSHYADGFEGFKNPAEHPYEVIQKSLLRGVERLKAIGESPEKLRPWIQDFDLGAVYGVAEVNKEKQATYDVGLTSWMAWDPSNTYTRAAYKK